jgi:aryl-alcohol dehydrogenase-like predicted oxidoreductase
MNLDEAMTGSQMALAWVLRRQEIACAVIGTTRLNHLLENLKASDIRLSERQLASIAKARSKF